MAPTKVPVGQFRLTGASVPTLFHAGRVVTTKVADHFFEGWYGWGYYAAFSPDFVRRWYGPIVTRLRVLPDTKVLAASVDFESSPPGLLKEILKNDFETNPSIQSDMERLRESMARLVENPVQWVHGVDRLAIEQGYDVIVYHDENVVVKNPDVVVVEGEESELGT